MKPFRNFQIRWAEKIGTDACWYMTRWVILFFGFAIRVHHWTNSDDQRYFHDHPWWMIIIPLKGMYWDISPDGNDLVAPIGIYYRHALHKHTVKLITDEVWTLLITGPKTRNWGFWVPGRDTILRPLRYFSKYGHHQCN